MVRLSQISKETSTLPLHIGVIMDGNGRWAQEKGKVRSAGHKEGLKAAKRITLAAKQAGIKYLSLYAFSTENWKRAEDEIDFIMYLIREHLKKEYAFYKKNGIRVVHSGDLNRLPQDIQEEITQVTQDTKHFNELVVNLAINYGGRDEIVRAVKKIQQSPDQEITEESISQNLDCPFIPDADLIIRTGGEKRISNFLLWRSAYAEFYFSPKLWPDWDKSDLYESIVFYQQRERRFGGIKK